MNDIPEGLQRLYAKFGQTAEMAQVMETEAGNFALAYVSLAFDPETISDDERRQFQALVDDVDARTFGNLLKRIRSMGTISEEIEHTLSEALEKRNYLMHRFFRVHNFAINSEEGRKDMCADLDQVYATLSRARALLHGMTHTFNAAFGRPNVSEEEALELARKGKRVKI